MSAPSSETPRTASADGAGSYMMVKELAQDLERELSAMTARAEVAENYTAHQNELLAIANSRAVAAERRGRGGGEMKRQIVVEIDCEEERCGECRLMVATLRGQDDGGFSYGCSMEIGGGDSFGYDSMRGPLCLAAEKKLAALIEAGSALHDSMSYVERTYDARVLSWLVAVDALKGGK